MKKNVCIPMVLVGLVSGLLNLFFASAVDWETFLSGEGVLTLAFALGTVTCANIPGEVLANIRRWHGKIDEQFDNINNIVTTVQAHQAWNFPQQLSQQLGDNCTQLAALIPKCRSNYGSAADRTLRNSLLKVTVGLCLTQVKSWAYTQYYAGVLTADDVHLLGFFLPGEAGGRHGRTEATDVLAEVKVSILNADFIHVVIDQAANVNAALVAHGWPPGVRQAVIVIMAADGKKEVLRKLTTHLHNDLRMPDGSHGKQFIAKAAFLKHVDDEPKFGPEPTFSMPLTTEDLAATLDRQHHEEFEAQMREVERHRQEVERLKAGDKQN
ncbi:MAG: hypothetical protein LBP98_06230 [Tannerella sp.]|jgi:hypothetical protein|nr:hypothetical protein [Tannerella sp.]